MDEVKRPDDAPDVDHPLLVAARSNDSEVDEPGMDLAALIKAQGLDLDALRYIAEQRALRTVLVEARKMEELRKAATTAVQIHLTPAQRRRLDRYTVTYLDGILLGWRARGIADG